MGRPPKGTVKGARSGPGYKLVNTSSFTGTIKDAWEKYVEAWETLENDLVVKWLEQHPNGQDGKSISFKGENVEEECVLKYILKAKRAGKGSARGDDIFGNPQ